MSVVLSILLLLSGQAPPPVEPPADQILLLACEPGGDCLASAEPLHPSMMGLKRLPLSRPRRVAVLGRQTRVPQCSMALTSAAVDEQGKVVALVGPAEGCGFAEVSVAVLDAPADLTLSKIELAYDDTPRRGGSLGGVQLCIDYEPKSKKHRVTASSGRRRWAVEVEGYVAFAYLIRDRRQTRVALLMRRPGFETSTDEGGFAVRILPLM